MANKKILLYGIGSLQNRGCEALVNSTIAQFDSTDEIVAATFDYEDRKSTRLNSSHVSNSYAVFCLKKKYITY